MMRRRALVFVATALVAFGACTISDDGDDPQTAPSTTTTVAPPATPPVQCADATASIRPPAAMPAPGRMPAGTKMAEIQQRGRLIVGVADDTLLFGFLNPLTNQLEGFDIDMAREVARAIFGNPNAIELRAIAYSQRLPLLVDKSVDLVANTFTVNCTRDVQIDFSTIYYNAGQRVLVRTDSTAKSIDELGGQRVCAATGSTSIENVRARQTNPPIEAVEVEDQTDCLVLFQQGKVDAISTDDTILAGLAKQDPYAKVVGEFFSAEPYGLGTSQDHPEFTAFVNGVLERMRADGTWARIYERWLGELFGPAPAPPAPRYEG
ncbi:MAG: glutamate ABC transporter substrate-binding protein [Acidimicrobiales bacterium]|nr:glutamate ABC transporter substrate-binding protein [Acidimicrobiales bacterium]